LHNLAGRWWALAIRGVAALVFALLTLLKPGITLVFLVLMFGMYAPADGVFNLVAAFGSPRHHWALLLEAIVSIVAGTLAFLRPGLTTFALLYLIACWAIFTGILEIVTGFRLRKVVANEWGRYPAGYRLASVRYPYSLRSRTRSFGDCRVDRGLRNGLRHYHAGFCLPAGRDRTKSGRSQWFPQGGLKIDVTLRRGNGADEPAGKIRGGESRPGSSSEGQS
jgi:hypothetical protein